MMEYGDMAGYAWIWMILGVAFWGTIIGLAIYAFTRADRRREGGVSSEEILRERYARGEIDAAEYDTRRRVLRG
jgi:putative membrane protein